MPLPAVTHSRIPKRRDQVPPVALITGAGRGIGRATAEAFVAEGYRVVLAELRPALGRRTEQALVHAGADALFLPTDVADATSVRRSVRLARHRFGRIDCLVNNAGVVRVGPLVDLSARDVDRMLAVNLRGPLLFAQAVLPGMLRQGSGWIINVASLLGKVGAAHYVTYCASKFGVVGFTQALAEELAGTGLRVFAVCPGLVNTFMARQAGIPPRDRRGILKPEAIARVIVDLATARSQEASGAAVDVP